MNEDMVWAEAHVGQIGRFAAENKSEHGRGVVEVNLKGEDATLSYTTTEELINRGVGKFEVALRAMVAASDPAENATLVIRRDSELKGCGMIETDHLTGWSGPPQNCTAQLWETELSALHKWLGGD